MLKMKTLTVGDKTYQLWDPEAARVEDTAVGENPWSSQKLVETFCPERTIQNGAFRPVEGSLLQPVIHFTHRQQTPNPTPMAPSPITGQDWLTLILGNGQTSREYEMALEQTVYCGSADLQAGVLTLTHRMYTVTGNENWTKAGTYGVLATSVNGESVLGDSVQGISSPVGFCSHAPTGTDGRVSWNYVRKASAAIGLEIVGFANGRWGEALVDFSVDKWKAYVREQANMGTPLQVLYQLDKPLTLELTPVQITALAGENTLSCGENPVSVTYRADPRILLEKLCID